MNVEPFASCEKCQQAKKLYPDLEPIVGIHQHASGSVAGGGVALFGMTFSDFVKINSLTKEQVGLLKAFCGIKTWEEHYSELPVNSHEWGEDPSTWELLKEDQLENFFLSADGTLKILENLKGYRLMKEPSGWVVFSFNGRWNDTLCDKGFTAKDAVVLGALKKLGGL